MAIGRAIRAAWSGLQTLVRFWAVLAFALLLPLAVQYGDTAGQRDADETAVLNDATLAITRWHGTGDMQFSRTGAGATVSVRISAVEWSALDGRRRAAVQHVLRQLIWHGARVDHCLIRDEGGGTLLVS